MKSATIRSRRLMIRIQTWSTAPRRNPADHFECSMQERQMMFTVIPRITKQMRERVSIVSFTRQSMKDDVIGPGAALHRRRQTQMRFHIHNHGDLGKTTFFLPTALAVVRRDMPRFQACGVDYGQRVGGADQAERSCDDNNGRKQFVTVLFFRSRASA